MKITSVTARAEAVEDTAEVEEEVEMVGTSTIPTQVMPGMEVEAEAVEDTGPMVETVSAQGFHFMKLAEAEAVEDMVVQEGMAVDIMEEAVEDTAVPDTEVVGLMLPEVVDLQQVATGLS